jgi:hypothetical protein
MDTNNNKNNTHPQTDGSAERLHPKAHRHLARFCVHCGHKCQRPVCEDCTRQSRCEQGVDLETGYFITEDGDEIGLVFDPYLRCME